MTTKGYDGRLDRLLTRSITVPGELTPNAVFTFNSMRSSVGGIDACGQWFLDGVNLVLWDSDAAGNMLPMGGSLTLDDMSMVTLTAEGGYTVTAVLVDYVQARDPFTFQPLANHLLLTLSAASALPAGESFTITLPTGGQAPNVTVEQRVWCNRRDFTGRDQINIAPGQFFELSDTRIIVRADGSWDVGDTFTLESDSYTVRGVARVGGREQYLELLSRAAG